MDRKSSRGGVAILIKSSISYSELKTPKNVVSLGIEIDSNVGKINIYNVYNPGIDINKEEYELCFQGDIFVGILMPIIPYGVANSLTKGARY